MPVEETAGICYNEEETELFRKDLAFITNERREFYGKEDHPPTACLLVLVFCLAFPMSVSSATTQANSVIGILTIFSSSDISDSSSNFSGHAWISFRNTSYPNIRFGGLNVAPNSEVTIGTFGNKSEHTGIWYNLESYCVTQLDDCPNRVSLSMQVTQSDLDTINSLISENNTWSLLNNCSSFAVRIWNAVSEDKVSAGFPNTPASLIESIKSYSYYETARNIIYNKTIGYVEDGIYYSCNPFTTGTNQTNLDGINLPLAAF